MGECCVEGISLQSTTTNLYIYPFGNWQESTLTTLDGSLSVGDIIKFTKQGNTISIYQNNTLLTSRNLNSNYTGFLLNTYNSRSITIKNLKIVKL